MKREFKLFIEDIADCIQKIELFVENMDFDEFIKDEKTNSAVVRKLEIIGEATKNIPKEIQQKYKELPWTDMARIRDKIIHGYFTINYEIVWKVIKQRLPAIKQLIEDILKDMESKNEK